ncbi:hypothetical protein ACTWPB_04045 [Nocardia sp. IBHARD005]|uniref:hypothetical protein n=1 Tax=Nocardia sp. IBHARD005 TaxID=3457765 RepID=UPI004059FD59
MKLARLFDGSDSDGHPEFERRKKITDHSEREKIATFLDGGLLVIRTTGLSADQLSSNAKQIVPMSYASDGTWVWHCGASYYLRKYGIGPHPELLRHIESCEYVANIPSKEELMSAMTLLQQEMNSQREP